jgi:hypothetical protein
MNLVLSKQSSETPGSSAATPGIAELATALRTPACYPHLAGRVETL